MSAPIDETLGNGKNDRPGNKFYEFYSDVHFLSIFGYIVIKFGLFVEVFDEIVVIVVSQVSFIHYFYLTL